LTAPRLAALLCAGVALAGAAGVALADAVSADSRVPRPAVVKGKGEACVEPVAVMRREHMYLLRAHRDETVHRGDRDPKHSLAGCVDCHAVPDAGGAQVPVNAPGQFCASCHAYASVRIDCFQCHATVPEGARVAARHGGPEPVLDRLSRALFGIGGEGRVP